MHQRILRGRSSRCDINKCSVGGSDVCVVQSGVAATQIAVNGLGWHPEAAKAAEVLCEVVQ
jgi:hypothetical protein